MANVERVVLNIDIDTDTRKLGSLTALLKAHEQQVNKINRSYKNMGRDLDRAGRGSDRLNRRVGVLGRTFNAVGRTAFRFITILTKFSFIAYAGQVAILTTALLGAKLAMASGRAVAQGYSTALRGVAATATAAATAIAIAAASMRQFQEAQLSPFTGGLGGAAARNRGLSSSIRGLLGAEASQQALKGLAKAGVRVSEQNAVARELFNISGGDSKQMTSLIGAISGEPGTFGKAVGASAGGAAAAKRVGDLQGAALIQMLASGGLTSGTGFAGLDQVMGQTVIGTLKTELQVILGALANAGEGLLGPTRDTIRLLSSTLTNFIGRIMPLIMRFGDMVLGSDGMASGLQKISNSLFKMINHTVPRLEGFMDRMSGMARATRMFFRDMADRMRPLEAGAEVLMDMFGNMFGGMVGNGVLDRFNRTLTANADSFREFGESIGNVFRAFFVGSGGGDSMVSVVDRMSTIFNQFATDVVPPLKEIANSIKDIILNGLPPLLSLVQSVLNALSPLFSVTGAVTGLPGGDILGMTLLGGALAGRRRLGRRGRTARGLGPVGGVGGAQGMMNASTAAFAALGLGRFGQRIAPGNTGGANFFRTTTLQQLGGRVVGHNPSPRVALGAGLGTSIAGVGGGLYAAHSIGQVHRTGEISTQSQLGSLAGGAMAGFMMSGGNPLGALAGAAVTLATQAIVAGFARARQNNNLREFITDLFGSDSESSPAAKLEQFNYTLENFEEVAKTSDMNANNLKNVLDELAPTFAELSTVIETQVQARVGLLTEVYGMHADEAEALARSMNELDFANLMTDQFNQFAQDATAGFGFQRVFGQTTANRDMMKQEQAALEAALRNEFGGDLDLAAKSEGGIRLIEALFNNIFQQSMLDPEQSGMGAETTAINALQTIFGPSSVLADMEQGYIELLTADERIANLLKDNVESLTDIATLMHNFFGGETARQLYDQNYAELMEKEGARGVGEMSLVQNLERNEERRQALARRDIGIQMTSLVNMDSPPVTISGVLTSEAQQVVQNIVEEHYAVMQSGLANAIADGVNNVSFKKRLFESVNSKPSVESSLSPSDLNERRRYQPSEDTG